MLELEVTPNHSLGNDTLEFILGMHFSEAVAILQQPGSSTSGIQVEYNQQNPLESDLVIHLSLDGIKLVFDPHSQCLKLINIINLKLVSLTYCDRVFNAPECPPTRRRIDDAFGSTYPERAEAGGTVLEYPGVCFSFPSDSKVPSQQTAATCVSLYHKSPRHAPPLPPPSYHTSLRGAEVQRVEGPAGDLITTGVLLNLTVTRPDGSAASLSRTVSFGDSCQRVLSAIGSPNKVFYKSEDRMQIHKCRKPRPLKYSDYYFNYFTLGIDVCLDARCHTVKKLVLHTNFPGYKYFNMYQRCSFSLPLLFRPSSQVIDLPDVMMVDPATKWSAIEARLPPPHAPPVVVRRNVAGGGGGGNTAPLRESVVVIHHHNLGDINFEVMSNSYIATVTLFDARPEAIV